MTFQPVPKPAARSESEKRVDALTKAWKRKDRWRAKAIAKAKGKPRPKVRERNEARIKRKAKAYRAVIASDFHKRLRYLAWERSGGYCECDECVMWRGRIGRSDPYEVTNEERDDAVAALTPFLCWFVNGGGAPHRRFRSNDAELHHDNYRLFGEENLAELAHVRLTWKAHHRRIEAEHSTRRRFLTGK